MHKQTKDQEWKNDASQRTDLINQQMGPTRPVNCGMSLAHNVNTPLAHKTQVLTCDSIKGEIFSTEAIFSGKNMPLMHIARFQGSGPEL